MQSINNSQLRNWRNQQYGWPTMYPNPHPEQAVQQMMQLCERRYQDLRQRLSQLQDIYLKTFLPYKK